MLSIFPKNKIAPSLQIPKVVRGFANCIQFFSSTITVYLATKLFTFPISFKTPKRELIMEENSQKTRLYIPSINKEVRVLSYGYSSKKVLLVHGWSGRGTQLCMIAHKLLEKGYMVVSFDGPAHGQSAGRFTNMNEFIDTIVDINKEFGPFESAIGHSFGGMALLNVVAQYHFFNSLVTIGSGDSVTDILTNFAKNLGVKSSIGMKMKAYFEKKWGVFIDDYAANELAKKVDIPTLVIHDSVDGDVDVTCAESIRKNLQKGVLLVTNGLGHTKILRDDSIIQKTTNFITKHATL